MHLFTNVRHAREESTQIVTHTIYCATIVVALLANLAKLSLETQHIALVCLIGMQYMKTSNIVPLPLILCNIYEEKLQSGRHW